MEAWVQGYVFEWVSDADWFGMSLDVPVVTKCAQHFLLLGRGLQGVNSDFHVIRQGRYFAWAVATILLHLNVCTVSPLSRCMDIKMQEMCPVPFGKLNSIFQESHMRRVGWRRWRLFMKVFLADLAVYPAHGTSQQLCCKQKLQPASLCAFPALCIWPILSLAWAVTLSMDVLPYCCVFWSVWGCALTTDFTVWMFVSCHLNVGSDCNVGQILLSRKSLTRECCLTAQFCIVKRWCL